MYLSLIERGVDLPQRIHFLENAFFLKNLHEMKLIMLCEIAPSRNLKQLWLVFNDSFFNLIVESSDQVARVKNQIVKK